MLKKVSIVVASLLLTVGVSGCGSSATGENSTSSQTTSSAAPSSAATSTSAKSSPSPEASAGLVIDVTIAGGKATPTNATYDASVNEPITLRVNSDAEDELHVHSTPDHEFEVTASPGQTFEFTVAVPGRVAVELHHLSVTIATINVS